jgi:hypothetical protein
VAVLDDHHEFATPRLQVGEKWIGGAVEVIQAISVKTAANRNIGAETAIHDGRA